MVKPLDWSQVTFPYNHQLRKNHDHFLRRFLVNRKVEKSYQDRVNYAAFNETFSRGRLLDPLRELNNLKYDANQIDERNKAASDGNAFLSLCIFQS